MKESKFFLAGLVQFGLIGLIIDPYIYLFSKSWNALNDHKEPAEHKLHSSEEPGDVLRSSHSTSTSCSDDNWILKGITLVSNRRINRNENI